MALGTTRLALNRHKSATQKAQKGYLHHALNHAGLYGPSNPAWTHCAIWVQHIDDELAPLQQIIPHELARADGDFSFLSRKKA